MRKILSLTIVLVMIMTVIPTAGILVSASENGVNSFSIAGTESLYSEFADYYDDPNWITDEDFFGVWDEENGTWIKESYFNYEKYSEELAEVEEAAKAGNYALAGEKITDYYREKFLARPIKETYNESTIIAAKMACYNVFGAHNYTNTDIVQFSQTEKLISGDITSIAKSAANDTNSKEYTFQIAATHDDGNKAFIYSRESRKAPYVKANVNGHDVTFPVVADTYLRGGNTYENINYGTTSTNPENKLWISTSMNFDKAGITFPLTRYDYPGVDTSGTMLTRLTVDFTGLNPGDMVNSAELCFTGAADDDKFCVVQWKADLGGKETDATWTYSQAAYRHMHSFYGLPGVIGFAGDHPGNVIYHTDQGNPQAAGALLSAYNTTANETYAYHAVRLYMAHINAWGNQPTAASGNQGNLTLGVRSTECYTVMIKLAGSKYFTADFVVPMLKYIWANGDALTTCWNSQSETTNWGTYETKGLASLCVNFKEFRDVDKPIEEGGYGQGKRGGWLALVNHRFYTISNNVINREDDSFTETMGYGKETINNFLAYPNLATEAGEPVLLEDKLTDNLNLLASYIVTVAGPRFTCFQYGDSYSYGSDFAVVAKNVSDITGDPFLKWAGSYGREGIAPDFTSKLYTGGRKAALKSGWSANDMYVDFSSDSTVLAHNHPDDLNISMFCYGEPLLTDARQYSYGTNDPRRNAVYATNMHNTLSIKVVNPTTGRKENLAHVETISGIYTGPYPVYSQFLQQEEWDNIFFNRNRTSEPGVIHRSELNDSYDYVEMSHTNYENWTASTPYAKANVNMKRSLLFLKDAKYMIVTDYVNALDDEEYIVAQNWHFLPSSNFTMNEYGVAETHYNGPNVQVIPVFAKSQMEAVYEQEGYYCPANGVLQHNPYPAYEKSGSGDKVYNTVILPTASGKSIKSQAYNLPLSVQETVATASRITMTDEDINQTTEVYYYFLHDTEKKSQRDFGRFATDSKMTFVELIGDKPSMIVIQDATNVTDIATGKALFKSTDEVEELSISYKSGIIELDTTKEINLETMTIRAEGTVNTVKLNGEIIDYNHKDNYIYFGDEPILSDPSKEDSEGGLNPGKHGSSSGGGGGSSSSDKEEEKKPETIIPVETPEEKVSARDFMEELSGHWGENEIATLINFGIVKGSDGKLNLKSTVTRAELLALIVRALGLQEKEYGNEFADVQAGDWYAGVIATAKAAGLVDGDGEMVMPDSPVTREQMAKFLVCAYEIKNSDTDGEETLSFTDSDKVSLWAVAYVDKATSLGILNGMGTELLLPKRKFFVNRHLLQLPAL